MKKPWATTLSEINRHKLCTRGYKKLLCYLKNPPRYRLKDRHRIVFPLLLLAFVLYNAVPVIANAGHLHPERWYQDSWCDRQKGVAEYRLPDRTRVDCLTDTHVVEVDFATKWYEAVGQSLHYALITGKRAGILLVMEKPTDIKYWKRMVRVVEHYALPIDVWQTKP